MREQIDMPAAIAIPRRIAAAILVAMVVVAATAASVSAQWPTGCVELNDIVERHLGNDGNVGIYQRVFGEQAEGACRSDHIEDVRAVFAWALTDLPHSASTEPITRIDISGWPTTCVDLNDIVERHLGNDKNVRIYQQVFEHEAETGCQHDHAANVRDVFDWAQTSTCDNSSLASHASSADSQPPAYTPATVISLVEMTPALDQIFHALPLLACSPLPWITDGATEYEINVLSKLVSIATQNADLATVIANSAWFSDGLDHFHLQSTTAFWGNSEYDTLLALEGITQTSSEMANSIQHYHWITERIIGHGAKALTRLHSLARDHLDLAILVARSPWLSDGVSKHEEFAVFQLHELADNLPVLAKQITEYSLELPAWDRNVFLIRSIARIYSRQPELIERLLDQEWFIDGLDSQERVFITALASTIDTGLQEDLLAKHFTQSKTITVPLADEVTLWVVQHSPFRPHDDHFRMMEEAIRGAETFIGVPFPANDLIMVLADDSKKLHDTGGAYGTSFIQAIRYPDGSISRGVVYHEISHLYFNSNLGPFYDFGLPGGQGYRVSRWLSEGGANFLALYIFSWTGERSLAESLRASNELGISRCLDLGTDTIYALLVNQEADYGCNYDLGENLLLNLFDTIGESALSAVLRELYLMSVYSDGHENVDGTVSPTSEEVYWTILKHTPAGREDTVRELYRRIHGGPFVDAVN